MRTRHGTTRPSAPAGRSLMFEDLDPEGQGVVARLMLQSGKVKSRLGKVRATTEATAKRKTNNPLTRHKAAMAVVKLDMMMPLVHDERVSIERAAVRRAEMFAAAARRMAEEDRPNPRGSGWYFEHRAALNETAHHTGMDEDVIVTASAMLSPNNSPENEVKAVDALAHAHSTNPELRFSPELGAVLGTTQARFSDLTPKQVALVSSAKYRGHTEGDIDVVGISAGGTLHNITRAVNVLRGKTPLDKAIDPYTSPKVWAYHRAITHAGEGLRHPEIREEYESRVHEAATGQQTLDLWNLRASHAGILDPQGYTAEDTWMHALTMGQPFTRGGPTGRMSVGKEAGSNKVLVRMGKTEDSPTGERLSASIDPRVSGEALKHAFDNLATRRAAEAMSSASMGLPSVAMQEVAWTEARIEAGKDPGFKREQRAKVAPPKQVPGQGTMLSRSGRVLQGAQFT